MANGDITVHGTIVTPSYYTNSQGVVSGPYPEHFRAAVLSRNGDIKYIYPKTPPAPDYHSTLRPDGSLIHAVTGLDFGLLFRTMYPDGILVTNQITYLLRTTVLFLNVLPNGHGISHIQRRYFSTLDYDYELLSEQWGVCYLVAVHEGIRLSS